MENEANSRDRPVRENYHQLMRHEDSSTARELPEKPVCTKGQERAENGRTPPVAATLRMALLIR